MNRSPKLWSQNYQAERKTSPLTQHRSQQFRSSDADNWQQSWHYQTPKYQQLKIKAVSKHLIFVFTSQVFWLVFVWLVWGLFFFGCFFKRLNSTCVFYCSLLNILQENEN